MESWYRHLLSSLVIETQIFSVSHSSSTLRFFSLSLIIETQTFSVPVLISSLRLTSFQSWYRSRNWEVRLGLWQCKSYHHQNLDCIILFWICVKNCKCRLSLFSKTLKQNESAQFEKPFGFDFGWNCLGCNVIKTVWVFNNFQWRVVVVVFEIKPVFCVQLRP